MGKFPNLKFVIDLNKDIEIFNGFLETAKFFDLTNTNELEIGFCNLFPEFKKIIETKSSQKQKNKLIKNFVIKIYQRDLTQISNSINETKKQWQKIQKSFFKKISILFKNYPWPKGKYIAYPTVWGIYPRFLKNKTFTFPYKCKNKKFILFVLMHETLHFIFYDYAIKKYPQIFKKLDTETGIFWDLAEIFNTIILSSPEFVKLHNQKDIFCYPQHRKYLPKLKKIWREFKDIDRWLIEGYKILKK